MDIPMEIDDNDQHEIIVEGTEDTHANAFTEYVSDARGLPHPTPLWEAAALSSFNVSSVINFKNNHLYSVLSSPQVEAVSLILKAHEKTIYCSQRLGFLLGDGTGTGKTRIAVSVILENWQSQNRKRSLWVTPSTALAPSIVAEFDFCQIIPTFSFNGKTPEADEGCLIVTYGDVYSKVDMIVSWLIGSSKSFDGVIVFDECHRVKNMETNNAKAALKIQSDLPGARILYVSATSSTELQTLEYMPRLGLWGPNLPFPDFASFYSALSSRGTLSLECVALELKMQGRYICRQLKFEGAEFKIKKVEVTAENAAIYSSCADLWVRIRNSIIEDANEHEIPNGGRKKIWSLFYSGHQRFFRSLLISFKLNKVIGMAKKKEAKGYSVVISLIKTGEANLKNDEDEEGSSVALIVKNIIEKLIYNPQIKAEHLSYIDGLGLPPNPLDALIYGLGGTEKVAELTGRRVKYDFDEKKSVSRGKERNLNKNLDDFQKGLKHFAVISAVASVGLSLHNDKKSPVNRRRFHINLELAWTAEETVQAFGRTLRSNQHDAPKYRVVIMDVSGETRFVAPIANRLQNMGALVHGNRESISQYMDFKKHDFDNAIGNEAVTKLFEALTSGGAYAIPTDRTPQQIAQMFAIVLTKFHGVDLCDHLGKRNPKIGTAMKFFNRLLGIPISIQNFVFDYFLFIFENLLSEKGTEIQKGVKVTTLTRIQGVKSQHFDFNVTDSDLTIELNLHEVSYDVSLSWKEAIRMLQNSEKDELVGFWISKVTNCIRPSVKLIIRQNGKYKTFMSNFGAINDKYSNTSGFDRVENSLDARENWENQRVLHGQRCWHFYRTNICSISKCEIGMSTQKLFVLSGSLVSAISILPFLKQITLIKFDHLGQQVCGLKIPPNEVQSVIDILQPGL